MNEKYTCSLRQFLGLGVLFSMVFLFNSCNEPKNEEGVKEEVLRNRFIIELKSYLNAGLFKKAESFFNEEEKYTKEALEREWDNKEKILPIYKRDHKTTIVYEKHKREKTVETKFISTNKKALIEENFKLINLAFKSGSIAYRFYSDVVEGKGFKVEEKSHLFLKEDNYTTTVKECKRLFGAFEDDLKTFMSFYGFLSKPLSSNNAIGSGGSTSSTSLDFGSEKFKELKESIGIDKVLQEFNTIINYLFIITNPATNNTTPTIY